ncbi:hypothetical protein [Salimicrobium album]|uniref:Uncharacterized protein n=1 Tax=Salimicrobium album TaxID=50717 RepID=A0A1H3DDS8_9BACI|nr:hypothetical protein [Salimicrobium album]SDX64546.1 hypothetical protein SAMN04488081_0926 [Salimicrobium album]
MKMPFDKRPTCACGVKMKFTEYRGYYDSFWYWECENCNIENEMERYEPDTSWKGAYA